MMAEVSFSLRHWRFILYPAVWKWRQNSILHRERTEQGPGFFGISAQGDVSALPFPPKGPSLGRCLNIQRSYSLGSVWTGASTA